MLEVRQVTKRYGQFEAVSDISFSVEKGRIVAFLGPNGAGKTTTMRMITGYMPPTSGTILLNGVDVFEDPETCKRQIGYLPENPPLYPELTVLEYLEFVANIKGVEKTKKDAAIEEAIEKTNLQDRRYTLIGQLSKGLKQRVGIAGAVVNHPALLILDEPTVGLDPLQVIEIRNLIKQLAKEEGRTVMLSTHILAEAEEICEQVIIIHNGRIMASESIEKLKAGLQERFHIRVEVKRSPETLVDILPGIEGVESVQPNEDGAVIVATRDAREEIAERIIQRGLGLIGLSLATDDLESVFLKLVR
ncbi:ABC transporter ATP-binding protein [Thermospira aquatica]|uniref:ABC transporter ATP-binding protein n=1 Tax=Thermospira aquatica TaxID=2828656 RepID=A0AAX3BAJ3_9SPIR|nr:ABC transporter ATP-binding protein [Thermospira aquatica]URA09276.1 ABC transporter ATP-binding protein [Thermospira aquatica]